MSLAESTINGYNPPFRLDCSAQGGVAVWMKGNLAYEQLSTIDCGDHEIIWLTVNLQGRKSWFSELYIALGLRPVTT